LIDFGRPGKHARRDRSAALRAKSLDADLDDVIIRNGVGERLADFGIVQRRAQGVKEAYIVEEGRLFEIGVVRVALEGGVVIARETGGKINASRFEQLLLGQ